MFISDDAMSIVEPRPQSRLFVPFDDCKLTLAQELHIEKMPTPDSCASTVWKKWTMKESPEKLVPVVEKDPPVWEQPWIHS